MAIQSGVVDIRSAQAGSYRQHAPVPTGAAVLPTLHLLVVEANAFALHSCCDIARAMGYAVQAAKTDADARGLLRLQAFDVILLDLKLEGGGLRLLEEIRRSHPRASVIVTTAYATVTSAVEAMRLGAVDYLTKPFGTHELTEVLEQAAKRVQFDHGSRFLRERLRSQVDEAGLIGRSPEMEKLYRMLSKIIPATLPVLITGEVGTGKKRVARWIHCRGPHAEAPFRLIECEHTSAAALQAELFGQQNPVGGPSSSLLTGVLGIEGATVFFDEIGALPFDVQGRLLRAMQDREFFPDGAEQAIPLRARILAGTSQDVRRMAELGTLRRDLYMRLNVVNLRMPALRERRSDIALLTEWFLAKLRLDKGTTFVLSRDAMQLLEAYEWPGNTGELEMTLTRATELASAPLLQASDLTTQLENFRRSREQAPTLLDAQVSRVIQMSIGNRPNTEEAEPVSMAERERRAILTTLEQMKGDKLLAAKVLGIGKTTLYRKLKEYGLRAG